MAPHSFPAFPPNSHRVDYLTNLRAQRRIKSKYSGSRDRLGARQKSTNLQQKRSVQDDGQNAANSWLLLKVAFTIPRLLLRLLVFSASDYYFRQIQMTRELGRSSQGLFTW
jgi:hypothetical protein